MVIQMPRAPIPLGDQQIKSLLDYVPADKWCQFSHIIASDLNALETEFRQTVRARAAKQKQTPLGIDLPLQALAEKITMEYLFPLYLEVPPTRPRYGLPLAQPAPPPKPSKRAHRVTFKEEVARVHWPREGDPGAQDRCNDHAFVTNQIHQAMGKTAETNSIDPLKGMSDREIEFLPNASVLLSTPTTL